MALQFVAGVGSSLLDFGGIVGMVVMGLSWLSMVQENTQKTAQAKANQTKLEQAQAELAQAQEAMAELQAQKQQLQADLAEQTASHAQALAALQAELTTAHQQLQKVQQPSLWLRVVQLSWRGVVGGYRWYARGANDGAKPEVAVAK